MPFQIEFHETLDSTNLAARRAVQTGAAKNGQVIVANSQTAGRGRLGRVWESPPRKNLTFSIVLGTGFSAAWPSELTIVTACSVVRSLSGLSQLNLRVRWPNDIFGHNHKVAGILLELVNRSFESGGTTRCRPAALLPPDNPLARPGEARSLLASTIIIGIGINVNSEPKDFSPELRDHATSLRMLAGKSFDKIEILNVVLRAIEADLQRYAASGLQPFVAEWMQATDLHGCQLRVEENDRDLNGEFAGLDPHGALLIRKNGKLETVVAGDVRKVRKLDADRD